jgi:hypothetical protein
MSYPTYFLNPVEDMKHWIEALRSGKYKQTKKMLSDGIGYCCLGVLAVEQTERAPEAVLYTGGFCYISIKQGQDIRDIESGQRANGYYTTRSSDLPDEMAQQFPFNDLYTSVEEIQALVPSVDVRKAFNNPISIKLDQGAFAMLNDQGASFAEIAAVIDFALAKLTEQETKVEVQTA